MEKVCSKCKVSRPLEEYGSDNRLRDKKRSWCRGCDRKRRTEYNKNNKEKRSQRAKEQRARNPEIQRNYGLKYRAAFPWRTLIQHARKRAAKFGWEFDLDDHIEELKARIAVMKCEMTGINLVTGVGAGSQGRRFYNSVSIDRIDASLGYTYQNVRIVCWMMNCAMGTWGEETLKKVMTQWLRDK